MKASSPKELKKMKLTYGILDNYLSFPKHNETLPIPNIALSKHICTSD